MQYILAASVGQPFKIRETVILGKFGDLTYSYRTTRKITEWTPYKTRPAGRPRLSWMDQVEEDLKRMKIIGWRAKVKDRQEWNRIVGQTKTHRGL